MRSLGRRSRLGEGTRRSLHGLQMASSCPLGRATSTSYLSWTQLVTGHCSTHLPLSRVSGVYGAKHVHFPFARAPRRSIYDSHDPM